MPSGEPGVGTLEALEALGVRVERVVNPFGSAYPIGNKLACLGIPTSARRLVFLDSDIVAVRDLVDPQLFVKHSFLSAKPADLASVPAGRDFWEAAYALFGLSLPADRMTASVTGELMPPYFNAGCLSVNVGTDFAEVWKDTALVIDNAQVLPAQYRVHLDQVSLSIALARAGVTYSCVSEEINYPAHLKPLNPGRPPLLVHYHWPSVLRREPLLRQEAVACVSGCAHSVRLIQQSEDWLPLLIHARRRAGSGVTVEPTAEPWPDAFLTGIPRSGTSFLCNAFHKLNDCVAINEPREIFLHLAQERTAWGLATYHLDLRRDILEGKAIENKVDGNEVVTDTKVIDSRQFYRPMVSHERFVLMTKNTLAYLARIEKIHSVMPHATLFACIRHPVDTVMSWEGSFPHLANVTLAEWPIGGLCDDGLTGWRRGTLQKIERQEHPLVKRALLWNYLARLIIDSSHLLNIIRYENLVSDPMSTVAAMHELITGRQPSGYSNEIKRSVPRVYANAIAAEQRDIVSRVCCQTAWELGYVIN